MIMDYCKSHYVFLNLGISTLIGKNVLCTDTPTMLSALWWEIPINYLAMMIITMMMIIIIIQEVL